MSTLGKIRIKGVRGIRTELPLDLDGKSLLLRGDNGTGKSSIAQALRWALVGAPAMSSFVVPDEFLRHRLENDPAACEVTIDLLPKGRIVMKGGRLDTASTDAEGQAYVDACVRSNPFLRRDELLGFLSDAPASRFKYLERFLELDRVERLGTELAERQKAHATSAKDAEAEIKRLLATAAAHLPREGTAPSSSGELVARLLARATALGLATDPKEGAGFDSLPAVRAKIVAKPPNAAVSMRRIELAGSLKSARDLVPPDHPRTVLTALRAAEQRALETDLAELLGEALGFVEKHPSLETCPVCEQSVEPDALTERLRARLAVLTEVRTLKVEATNLGSSWRDFLLALEALESSASGKPTERTVHAKGRALLDALDGADGDSLSARVLARLEAVRVSLATQHDAIPDDLRASELGSLAKAIDAALGARQALEQAEASLARHARLARELKVIEKAVSGARKDVAEEILDGVAEQVGAYYERIHPLAQGHEVTGAPRIQIMRHGGGTAHVRGTFNAQEIDDPRLVYSDGHLDTVGICIFLALRKRAGGTAKLLVLDDIVLSIDLDHAGRLVELLRDEFRDHQILLFSHNEAFLRMAREPLSHAKSLDIVRWSLDEGPRLAGRVTHVERLRRMLDTSGSAADVAMATRPVLDDLLVASASAYELRLPTTQRGLTVDEYWSVLRPKLVELTKAGVLPDLTGTFEKIGTPSFFRNALGAHLNEWALEVPLRQVQCAAEGILELVDHLRCARCTSVARLVDPRAPKQGLKCNCPGGAPSLAASTRSTKESS